MCAEKSLPDYMIWKGPENPVCDLCGERMEHSEDVEVYMETLCRARNKVERMQHIDKLLLKLHPECAVKLEKLVPPNPENGPDFLPPDYDTDYGWAEDLAKRRVPGIDAWDEFSREVYVDGLIMENGIVPWRCNVCGRDFEEGDQFVATSIDGPLIGPELPGYHELKIVFLVAGKKCGCAERLGLAPESWEIAA